MAKRGPKPKLVTRLHKSLRLDPDVLDIVEIEREKENRSFTNYVETACKFYALRKK
jgi:hypothetical protein